MKMSVNRFILIVILAVIADRSYRIKKMFDVFPSQYNDGNCKLKGEMMGNEDMALGKFSVLFIGSSGNLDQCFKHGSASAQPGGIYILDIKKGQEAEPQQIYVQNSPYTVMHAHGIYVSNKTDRLYVVDHLGLLYINKDPDTR
ncbi:uncharacterized protein LOC111717470, partial [Eurytemora carolleeae]|uniref:uncharacterized protein LOC111717470 n=1 Tax=Eurytemora carolleeae TaxID=1294199 RepID=UPI000C761212